MTTPTKHPKSGVYRLRLTVPQHLRATTEKLYGVKRELTQTLGTKDQKQAKLLAPDVLKSLQGKLTAAEAHYTGAVTRLTGRQISAMCGRWLAREEARTSETNPEPTSVYEEQADFLGEVLAALENPEALSLIGDAEEFFADDLAWLLAAEGLTIDRQSKRDLISRLSHVRYEHTRGLIERTRTGTWKRAPLHSSDFAPASAISAPSALVSFETLLTAWALDRGLKMEVRPMPRNLYDRYRAMERLATFLVHRDASKVTKDDAVRWKVELLGRDLHASTVRKDLSEMSAIWKWAVANALVLDNPFAGILPAKPKKRRKEVRGFTDAEAQTILMKAREAKGYLRWMPWLLCATGARLTELAQGSVDDIAVIEGVHVIKIHDDGAGSSIKNEGSRRVIPLHPRLISEGFLTYVQNLPAGSDLWPDMAKDKQFGVRSGTGGRRIRWWLRQKVGIIDPRVSPSHSWRHWFIDAARRSLMPKEVRSAITGHSDKADESDGYGAGMGSLVKVLAQEIEKIEMPL